MPEYYRADSDCICSYVYLTYNLKTPITIMRRHLNRRDEGKRGPFDQTCTNIVDFLGAQSGTAVLYPWGKFGMIVQCR